MARPDSAANSPDPRMPEIGLKAQIANNVLLPVLNVLTSAVPFLKKTKERHAEDTSKAHAEAKGTSPFGKAWFDEQLDKSKFTVVVFYRGIW